MGATVAMVARVEIMPGVQVETVETGVPGVCRAEQLPKARPGTGKSQHQGFQDSGATRARRVQVPPLGNLGNLDATGSNH